MRTWPGSPRRGMWVPLCVGFAVLFLLASCAIPGEADLPADATLVQSPGPESGAVCPTPDPGALQERQRQMVQGQFPVDAYGAHPGDACDDGPAIREAIRAATAAGPGSTVLFSPGRYMVDVSTTASHHLTIQGANGLCLGGDGTELVFRNPAAGGFRFSDSEHCVIRDLTLDYEPVPFTQGAIVEVSRSADSFTIQIDDGYPSLDEPWFQTAPNRWGSVRERETRMIKPSAMDHVFLESWRQVEEGLYKLLPQAEYKAVLNQVEVGDAFVYVARQGGGAVDIVASHHITVENVCVYAAPTQAVTLYKADSVAIRGLRVAIRPGTDRLNSTNSDGIHCQQARVGPLVEHCSFEGMSDDGINIYTVPNIVQQKLSESKVICTAACALREGDLVEVWDPVRGRLRGISHISKLSGLRGLYVVTFEEPMPDIRAGADYRTADHLYNRNACGEGFVIRDNLFQNHRRHGIYIKSGHGLIEGNTIRNVSGFGIVVANEPDWPEGPMSRDITIRNNTIDNVGYPGSYGMHRDGAAIQIKANRLGFGLAEWRGQREILLEGNRITRWPTLGIYVGGARDVTLRDNVIDDGDERSIPGARAGLLLEHCDTVVVDALTVRDRRELQAAVVIAASADADGITLDHLEFEGREDVPEILDLRLSK